MTGNPCAEVKLPDKPMRAWAARLQYPGLKEFYFGTVMVRHNAPFAEVEDEAFKKIDEVLSTRPKLLKMIPGMVFFVPENEGDKP